MQIFALSYCLLAFKGPLTAFSQSTSAASLYDENIDNVDDLGEGDIPEVHSELKFRKKSIFVGRKTHFLSLTFLKLHKHIF